MGRISIKSSKKFDQDIKELQDLIGHTDLWGGVPKTLAFSTTFSIKTLAFLEKVIPFDLDTEMPIILASMKVLRKRRLAAEKIAELQKDLQKVAPSKSQEVPKSPTSVQKKASKN